MTLGGKLGGRRGTDQRRRRAFNLLELLVVIAIVALLLAIGLPSLRAAREKSRRLTCASRLRQWGVATHIYRTEFQDYFPTEGTYLDIEKPYTWFNELPPLLDLPPYKDVERIDDKFIREFPNLHVWICPSKNLSDLYKSNTGKNQFHYGMNRVLDGTGKEDGGVVTPGFLDQGDDPMPGHRFAKKPNTVYMFDIAPNDPNGDPRAVGRFHEGFANVLFLTGRVEPFSVERCVVGGDWRNGQIIWDDPDLYWGYLPPKDP